MHSKSHLPSYSVFAAVIAFLSMHGGFVSSWAGDSLSITQFLSVNSVISMEGNGDTLWAGTRNAGVVRWSLADTTFKQFTLKDGLSSNTIYSLERDSAGSVWAGTQNGICCYVNSHWTAYTSASSVPIGQVYDLAVNAGIVAGATAGGVCVWNNGAFVLQAPAVGGFLGFKVNRLSIADNGEIWIAGSSSLAHGTLWNFSLVALAPELNGSPFTDIAADTGGHVWVATGNIVARYTNPGWKTFTNGTPELSHGISSLDVSKTAQVWGASFDGVSHFKNGFWDKVYSSFGDSPIQIKSFSSASLGICLEGPLTWWDGTNLNEIRPNGLENNDIRFCAVDGNDNLWVVPYANSYGIERYNDTTWSYVSQYSTGLIHNSVTSMTTDSAGGLWFGTDFGVSSYHNMSWQKFMARDGLPFVRIRDLTTVSNGAVWAACYGGVLCYENGAWRSFDATTSGLPGTDVTAVAQTRDGTVWVGTERGISYFSNDHFLPPTGNDLGADQSRIHGLAAFGNNGLLVASDLGCSFFEGGKWRQLLPGAGICNDIAIDSGKRIWVATMLNGIYLLDSNGVAIKHITNKDGLNSNLVYALARSHHGTMWAATNSGVAEIFMDNQTPVVEVPYHSAALPYKQAVAQGRSFDLLGRQLPFHRKRDLPGKGVFVGGSEGKLVRLK